MPDSLPDLESARSKILSEFSTLGDLRPGSICAVVRRCGKPTCHCATGAYTRGQVRLRVYPERLG